MDLLDYMHLTMKYPYSSCLCIFWQRHSLNFVFFVLVFVFWWDFSIITVYCIYMYVVYSVGKVVLSGFISTNNHIGYTFCGCEGGIGLSSEV